MNKKRESKGKTMMEMKGLALLFLLVCLVFLNGCSIISDLKETANENMEIERKLPEYELNIENFKEISYDDKTYIIQETEVDSKILEEPIGKISRGMTINDKDEILDKRALRKLKFIPDDGDEKRIHLSFGWIYSIKDVSPDKEVAVVINHKYHLAKIK